MSPSRQSFVAQPRVVPKLVDFPVEIISCGPATVVALCARGQRDTDLQSPLQSEVGGGSPRTPIQTSSTPMWLGELPYWKDSSNLNFSSKVNDLVQLPAPLPHPFIPSRSPSTCSWLQPSCTFAAFFTLSLTSPSTHVAGVDRRRCSH
jgi:hypothetical protein